MGNKNSVIVPIKPAYRKDKFYIYWNDLIIEEALVDSFTDLGFGYAKDQFDIFYNGNIIANVDISTFIVEKNGYTKDKINIFYNGMKNISKIKI